MGEEKNKTKNKKKQKASTDRILTGKEMSFCKCYIECGKKPSEAYKLSLYKSDNMTSQTISTKAYYLLRKGYIGDMIDKLDSEVIKKVKEDLVFGLKETLEGIIILAQGAKTENSKLKAFDMLMKHYGGYKEDNTQRVSNAEPFNISFGDFEKENKKS